MAKHMLPEIAAVVEGLSALGAEEWGFTIMRPDVISKGARLLEGFVADRTLVRFFNDVRF